MKLKVLLILMLAAVTFTSYAQEEASAVRWFRVTVAWP